jgi:hypothetical protein
VAAGVGVLPPLKKFYKLKKWHQKSEKNYKNFFHQQKFLKFLGSFLNIFHPCSTSSRAATDRLV